MHHFLAIGFFASFIFAPMSSLTVGIRTPDVFFPVLKMPSFLLPPSSSLLQVEIQHKRLPFPSASSGVGVPITRKRLCNPLRSPSLASSLSPGLRTSWTTVSFHWILCCFTFPNNICPHFSYCHFGRIYTQTEIRRVFSVKPLTKICFVIFFIQRKRFTSDMKEFV